ncbi:MAG: phosphoribosylanthranilate isomerase [Gammaproteobacteria bacterium]|nr:phosphoribosylanthranilate isomerase [Gammaproteobacteria bacterium]MDE2252373.1 phosphoribosylanthranilate isomerase [Gammaproteobacteria bacterium]
MNGWIKICGMTTAEGVAAAVAAGVDAIGFVFAPSPRRVTAERAAELALPARQRLTCVAVTQHPAQAQVDEIVREFHPDLMQTDLGDFAALHLPQRVARLPVLRAGAALPADCPPRLLYEGARSGSGELGDWQRGAALARRTRLVLAGGLSAANVAAAIRAVRPFGVDASSSLESRPGYKDAAKIMEFVQAARAAFSEIEA